MEKEKRFVESGTPQPASSFRIDILSKGPYLVHGNPLLQQEILVLNEEQIPWEYVKGHQYPITEDPTALCRCGHSKNHPFCDGSHAHTDWDATLTADNIPLLENAELYDGPSVQLADNPRYCVNARICMARGTVWRLTQESDDPEARDLAIHESIFCPSGRLKMWDKGEDAFIEPLLKPEIGLFEDPQKECSGPLWVKGGIPINGPDGTAYEQRNRVTLCRCGASSNKPYCDGTHLTVHFQDNLPLNTELEEKMN